MSLFRKKTEKNNQDILINKIFDDLKNSDLWKVSNKSVEHSIKPIKIHKDEQGIEPISCCLYLIWNLYIDNTKFKMSQKDYYILEELCDGLVNDKNKINKDKIVNELLNSYRET